LWVVHAGTNNLVPKKGLRDSDRDALRVLVRALLTLNPKGEGSRVLVTGLFYRRDEITKELVDRANDKIRDVVRELAEEFGRDRVRILAAPQSFDPGKHLQDHVHLTPEGYKLWMTQLVPAVVASLV
jgi:lysophospholipase L1-like esterase